MSLWRKKILEIGKQRIDGSETSSARHKKKPESTDFPSHEESATQISQVGPGVDHRINKYTAGKPVDYSFRKVENLAQLERGIPRQLRVGVPKKGNEDKYITSSLWASNNQLTNLKSLQRLVMTSLQVPNYISWLDLSFNRISIVTDEITQLRNLKILYLHGNRIRFLIEVSKLKGLKKLKTLSLHGNPIEEIPMYRTHVITIVPQVQNLDFSFVSRRERTAVLR